MALHNNRKVMKILPLYIYNTSKTKNRLCQKSMIKIKFDPNFSNQLFIFFIFFFSINNIVCIDSRSNKRYFHKPFFFLR